jgi:hypothetical protein
MFVMPEVDRDRDALHPLGACCRRFGDPIPEVKNLPATDVPEPYQTLLVHDDDMTPTLERIYGKPVYLNVLRQWGDNEVLGREVVIEAVQPGMVVVYGTIEICLQHFPGPAVTLILEGVRPLGGILEDFSISHSSHASQFFQASCTCRVEKIFPCPVGTILFGRKNQLRDAMGNVLADVVEMVPP